MRRVTKNGTGGYHLAQAHGTPPVDAASATSRWRNFADKSNVLQRLLDEQYQLCCYSEIRSDKQNLGYHIEHVENKSQAPQRTFDYGNLAASALDSNNGLGECKRNNWEVFGGHAAGKQASCDMGRFIPPHQTDCARFFAYLSDGRVIAAEKLNPADRDRAEYTIALLNLNSPYLITARQAWWDELDALYQQHLEREWNLPDLAAIDLVPSNQSLSPFFSLTRQFFDKVAENVLLRHAPQLA